MTSIKPNEFKDLHLEKNESKIDFSQLTESSLKNIDEIQKLFPKWKRERIIKKLKDTHQGRDYRFVATKDLEIVAHVKIRLGKSIHEHVAEITSLIVDPSNRRRGIGRNLMKYAINKIPSKIKILTLVVDSKNKKAIALYKKLGFEKYGLLKKGSKIENKFVDNYLMKKEL